MFFDADCIDAGQKNEGHENEDQETDSDKIYYQRVNENDPEQRQQYDQELVLLQRRKLQGVFIVSHLYVSNAMQ